MKQSIDEKLNQGIPVYITRQGLSNHNPNRQFSNLFFENYELMLIGFYVNEDWHKGAEVLQTQQDGLLKIEFKTPEAP